MHTSYLCGNETELTGEFQYAASDNHGFMLVNGCQWLKCTMQFFKEVFSIESPLLGLNVNHTRPRKLFKQQWAVAEMYLSVVRRAPKIPPHGPVW